MSKHGFSKEDINSRKVSNKDQRNPDELKVEAIQGRFNEAMQDIGGLSNIYETLSAEANIDESKKSGLQDLLRSQILLMKSALDLYMHEVSKYGIIKVFNNHPHWARNSLF